MDSDAWALKQDSVKDREAGAQKDHIVEELRGAVRMQTTSKTCDGPFPIRICTPSPLEWLRIPIYRDAQAELHGSMLTIFKKRAGQLIILHQIDLSVYGVRGVDARGKRMTNPTARGPLVAVRVRRLVESKSKKSALMMLRGVPQSSTAVLLQMLSPVAGRSDSVPEAYAPQHNNLKDKQPAYPAQEDSQSGIQETAAREEIRPPNKPKTARVLHAWEAYLARPTSAEIAPAALYQPARAIMTRKKLWVWRMASGMRTRVLEGLNLFSLKARAVHPVDALCKPLQPDAGPTDLNGIALSLTGKDADMPPVYLQGEDSATTQDMLLRLSAASKRARAKAASQQRCVVQAAQEAGTMPIRARKPAVAAAATPHAHKTMSSGTADASVSQQQKDSEQAALHDAATQTDSKPNSQTEDAPQGGRKRAGAKFENSLKPATQENRKSNRMYEYAENHCESDAAEHSE